MIMRDHATALRREFIAGTPAQAPADRYQAARERCKQILGKKWLLHPINRQGRLCQVKL